MPKSEPALATAVCELCIEQLSSTTQRKSTFAFTVAANTSHWVLAKSPNCASAVPPATSSTWKSAWPV